MTLGDNLRNDNGIPVARITPQRSNDGYGRPAPREWTEDEYERYWATGEPPDGGPMKNFKGRKPTAAQQKNWTEEDYERYWSTGDIPVTKFTYHKKKSRR